MEKGALSSLERTDISHRDTATSLAVVDDRHIASGAQDRTIRIIDTTTWRACNRIEALGSVETLATLGNGIIAAGHSNGKLAAWDALKGDLLWSMETKNGIWASTVLSNGMLACGTSKGEIAIVDPHAQDQVRSIDTGSGGIFSLIELSGERLCSASSDRTVRIWERNGLESARFEMDARVGCLALPSKEGVLAGDFNGGLHLLTLRA